MRIHCICLSVVITLASAAAAQLTVPLPPSSYELVAGGITTLETPADRAAGLAWLDQARTNFTLLAASVPPWHMEVSFTAQGFETSNGLGSMQETWLGAAGWAWTAEIGGAATDRYGYRGLISSTQAHELIPLPEQMIREALFWPVQYATDARLGLRAAHVSWNGAPATCVLVAPGAAVEPQNSRGWNEAEYCVDNAHGLLQMASQAPGEYEVYDYQGATNFHGHVIPGGVQIVENGQAAVMIRVTAMADAAGTNPQSLRTPAVALAQGLSFGLTGPWHQHMVARLPGLDAAAVVVIEADAQLDGAIADEIVAGSTNLALNDTALQRAHGLQLPKGINQREVFILFEAQPGGRGGRG